MRADALRENYTRLSDCVGPDARLLPMVKADAYGLGVARVVDALEPLEPWGFGVATVDEGVALRRRGVERPIVLMSPVAPGQVELAVAEDLQISVSSLSTLDAITSAASRLGKRARVHVDVDTGMGRSGFDWKLCAEWMPRLCDTIGPDVEWVGCYTHLHSADEGLSSIREQWDRLRQVLESVDDRPSDLVVHVLNSAGAHRAPEYADGLVRPGIFLYGGGIGTGQPVPAPVVSLRTRVVHIKDVTAGTTLGYGATYRAAGPERWATLSIGYGDGLPRALGNGGSVLLEGRVAPMIGRISMDVTVVDITDAPGISVGDIATVIGSDGEKTISLDEVALKAGTISYEILTGLTSRLPRIWTDLDG